MSALTILFPCILGSKSPFQLFLCYLKSLLAALLHYCPEVRPGIGAHHYDIQAMQLLPVYLLVTEYCNEQETAILKETFAVSFGDLIETRWTRFKEALSKADPSS